MVFDRRNVHRERASFRAMSSIMLFTFASSWESPFCDSLRNLIKKHLVSFHEPILTPPDKAATGCTFWCRRMSAREHHSQKCTGILINNAMLERKLGGFSARIT